MKRKPAELHERLKAAIERGACTTIDVAARLRCSESSARRWTERDPVNELIRKALADYVAELEGAAS